VLTASSSSYKDMEELVKGQTTEILKKPIELTQLLAKVEEYTKS